MILLEDRPENQSLTNYIDRYQLFIIKEPTFLKTIPNGKIECYLIKEGSLTKWNIDSESFNTINKTGILPATGEASIYHIPSKLICLNIKFKLNILGFSLFSGLLSNWQKFDVTSMIPILEQKKILSNINEENPAIDVNELDRVLKNALKNQSIDKNIDTIVNLIQDPLSSTFRVIDLANRLNMSQKSTERWIQKQFKLTPKKLLQIIRFEHTSYKLKNQPKRNLMDSLEFGYYDHSHFIKECQKITGYPPKTFFSKMKLQTNDLIFE